MIDTIFEYKVRVSARSRSWRLRVTLERGLEVVIPRGYDERGIPALLERKKRWIRAALDRAESHRKTWIPEPAWHAPGQIDLPATGASWQVIARATKGRRVVIREGGPGELAVSGAIDNKAVCQVALSQWLVRHAREYLVPRLNDISMTTGLHWKRWVIKRQRTRWGSCSAKGTISLNAKLMFVPPDLVAYVIIHELCHRLELNHSKRFWRLVERHRPDFRECNARLREMWKSVPRWAEM